MLEPTLIVKRLVNDLLLPPGGPLVVAAVGLWIARRRRHVGFGLAAAAIAVGLILCTPIGAHRLTSWVEERAGPALSREALDREMRGADPPMAIVVLAGGTQLDHRELPHPDTPSSASLKRALHAVRLARWSDLPLLVSGASVYIGRIPEARTISRVIREDFGHPVRWVEDGSIDTIENAASSVRLLRGEGVERIVLVTDAMHMPRSVRSFERAGVRVLPAPMDFSGQQGADVSTAWLPSIRGVTLSNRASHELAGLAWQNLRALFGR